MSRATTSSGTSGAHMPTLPLGFLNQSETAYVVKVRGGEQMRKHLSDLGLVEGAEVKLVSKNGSNIIVQVKGAQLALDGDIARSVIVRQ